MAPLGRSGRFAVATRDGNLLPTKVRIWPGQGESVWFQTKNAINGFVICGDGKHIVASGWNTSELYQLGKNMPIASGMGVGLFNGKPATIGYSEKSANTYLNLGSKRTAPPRGRQFLLIAPEGGWIATERVLDAKAQDEGKYWMHVELWKVAAKGSLLYSRSLGKHWWDGGSTGVPTIFSVAGNGIAILDQPAGGGALQFPVVVAPGMGPEAFRGQHQMKMMTFLELPVAFRQGFLCHVWAVDRLAWKDWDAHQTTSLMEVGDDWLAWFDGAKALFWKPPVGYLSAWRESDLVAGYAVRVPGGVEVRKLSIPPSAWRTLN
jgi:hypothetical protein